MASETIRTLGGLSLPGELAVKRILKPVTYALAALYFLADAAFMAIAKPISDWLARHVVLRRLRAWIRSLRPYPSLALFSIPVIMLEPIKPVAAYLAATGQMVGSVVILIVGELLKLVLIERPVQPYPGQADENSRLCLGVHKIPRSQDMAEKYRGLASHSRNKQACPSVSNRDEEIRCSGVSAVLKDCGAVRERSVTEPGRLERVALPPGFLSRQHGLGPRRDHRSGGSGRATLPSRL